MINDYSQRTKLYSRKKRPTVKKVHKNVCITGLVLQRSYRVTKNRHVKHSVAMLKLGINTTLATPQPLKMGA